ncbi:MAG: endonuclease III domain-containing protein [Candidatus Helarchaeota archaeon]
MQENLLTWYEDLWQSGKNQYPWRFPNKSPYEILIAEILLVHTTAKAIIDNEIYQNFLRKYPNLEKLNRAPKRDIVELLRPIGLYNQKSKRIKELCKVLLDKFEGKIPNSKEQYKDIPMIGDYIGNALLTFAFGRNEVPLDGNLKRIAYNVARLTKKKDLMDFYKKLSEKDPKKIYWALFDLGRYHCRKPKPNCDNCPLFVFCKEKK